MLIQGSKIAGAGAVAQSIRMKIAAENIAHYGSSSLSPNINPYRRKVVFFKTILDGTRTVVSHIEDDKRPFNMKFDPGNPAADKKGYVKYSNVNNIIEMSDLNDAKLSYDANMLAMSKFQAMLRSTLKILDGGV